MTTYDEIKQLEQLQRTTTNWEELAKIRVILFALKKEVTSTPEFPTHSNQYTFWR